MATFTLRVHSARRRPDPNFYHSDGLERHDFTVALRKIPSGISLKPNARLPNPARRIYREIEQSMLNLDGEPGTFHLKHKGITILAESVQRDVNDKSLYTIFLDDNKDGIVDGGHTYELIKQHLELDDLPDNQYIPIVVQTRIKESWVPEISGGLNTSLQVQEMSLAELDNQFDWIKQILKGETFFHEIAWRENDPGEFDARDIVAMLTVFNIFRYPNDSESHPVAAYSQKATTLRYYLDNRQEFEKLAPILKDILVLFDTIRYEARDHWNDGRGKAGLLSFIEPKRRGAWEFPFIQKSSNYRLVTGTVYPLLGSFRWMVVENTTTGQLEWRGGFERVLETWREASHGLLTLVNQTNQDLGRNITALGKNRGLWSQLHDRVAKLDLMIRQNS